MKIKDYKCKCGQDDFFFAYKGNQTGIYCSYCGKWLKWADKDEQNLRMKQEPRKGHWITTSDYLTTAYGSVDYVKCSCCGEDSLEEGNFCPNCGADMRESEDKE